MVYQISVDTIQNKLGQRVSSFATATLVSKFLPKKLDF